jgi:hypothetical protein
LAATATIALGLASRSQWLGLTRFLGDYPGDTLWALCVFLLIACACPRGSTRHVALAAASFATAVELSQLYQAPWINEIRRTSLGGLILGQGFLWSDLVCYACGILLGVLVDRLLFSPSD